MKLHLSKVVATEGEIALGPLLQAFVQSPYGVVRSASLVDP